MDLNVGCPWVSQREPLMRAALGNGEVSQYIQRVGDDTFIRN